MTPSPKFRCMTSFWLPKWPNFEHFHQKWPILFKLTPINGIFHKIYVHKPNWNNFCKLLEIKYLLWMFQKIISISFMDIYLVKNIINCVNLVKIRHLLWKWSKLAHFGCKNYVICQNLGKVVKIIFLPKFGKKGGSILFNLTKNVIKGVISAKIFVFGCFPYIS